MCALLVTDVLSPERKLHWRLDGPQPPSYPAYRQEDTTASTNECDSYCVSDSQPQGGPSGQIQERKKQPRLEGDLEYNLCFHPKTEVFE